MRPTNFANFLVVDMHKRICCAIHEYTVQAKTQHSLFLHKIVYTIQIENAIEHQVYLRIYCPLGGKEILHADANSMNFFHSCHQAI